jgi:hypothetical protein
MHIRVHSKSGSVANLRAREAPKINSATRTNITTTTLQQLNPRYRSYPDQKANSLKANPSHHKITRASAKKGANLYIYTPEIQLIDAPSDHLEHRQR